jgi:hypothetical protein
VDRQRVHERGGEPARARQREEQERTAGHEAILAPGSRAAARPGRTAEALTRARRRAKNARVHLTTLAASVRPWNHRLSSRARAMAGRIAFVAVVVVLAVLAVYVAGAPAWVFAIASAALGIRLWTVELALQDRHAALAELERTQDARTQALAQRHQERVAAIRREREADRERCEALLADLRSTDGESRPAVLEYRFRHLYRRPLRDLERRGFLVRVEEDAGMVRVYRHGEVKAEVPLHLLLPPAPGQAHNGRFEHGRLPLTLEPSLEEL